MNKQERIKELLELMNIPEFEKLINIKVEELKIILARKIKMYYKLKSEFKRAKQEVLFENGVVGSRTYFFELNRVEDSDSKIGYSWILKKIEPEPGIYYIDEVIPPDVVTYLGGHATNPTKIEFNDFFSEQSGKAYDIKSIKYNDSRVFGTIRTVQEGKKVEDTSLEEKRDTITLDFPHKEIENEEKYTELFRYMEKYPEIKEHIFTYFYVIQKPLVDNAEEMAAPPPTRFDKVLPEQ